MKARRLIHWVVLAAYAVMWCGGVAGQVLTGGPPAGAAWTSGVFLLLAGLIVVLFFTAIALASGLRLAALVGLGLCTLHLALPRFGPGLPALSAFSPRPDS